MKINLVEPHIHTPVAYIPILYWSFTSLTVNSASEGNQRKGRYISDIHTFGFAIRLISAVVRKAQLIRNAYCIQMFIIHDFHDIRNAVVFKIRVKRELVISFAEFVMKPSVD